MTKQGLGSGMWWTCGPAYLGILHLHMEVDPAELELEPERVVTQGAGQAWQPGKTALGGGAVGQWEVPTGNTFSHPLQPWTWAWA